MSGASKEAQQAATLLPTLQRCGNNGVEQKARCRSTVSLQACAGRSATEDELKRHCLQHAPAYMHPRRVWIVDAFPLAGTNKIDRKVVTALAMAELEGAPAS